MLYTATISLQKSRVCLIPCGNKLLIVYHKYLITVVLFSPEHEFIELGNE